ncbi:MAG: DUF1059 domain-containing protein [Nitrospirales bacterium]
MGKVIECAKVDPSSGCKHVIRGNTEEEAMKNAMEHAKSHGIREATPNSRHIDVGDWVVNRDAPSHSPGFSQRKQALRK